MTRNMMAAFADPEVAALGYLTQLIFEYQNNPKVMNLVTKMAGKMGGDLAVVLEAVCQEWEVSEGLEA